MSGGAAGVGGAGGLGNNNGIPYRQPPNGTTNGANGINGAKGVARGAEPAFCRPPVPTTTTLQAMPNPAKASQAVTLTATVVANTGIPTGVVAFRVDGAAVPGCKAVRLDHRAPDTAVCIIHLGPGRDRVKAFYAGKGAFEPSHSKVLRERVR